MAIIGAGAVGSELARKLVNNKLVSELTATRRNVNELNKLGKELKIRITTDNKEAVANSDVIIFAVRPQEMKKTIQGIGGAISSKQIVVSIAVGIEIDFYEKLLPNNPIIRLMPNPFLQSCLGILGYSENKKAGKKEVQLIRDLFEPMCEKLVEVPDKQMHLFTTLASSSSAIFYYIFNSLIEKARNAGLDEKTAMEIILLSAKAASLHALKSGKAMADLIDSACTPGGMSIDGIKCLQDNSVDLLVKKAVQKIVDKSIQINDTVV